MFGPVRLSPVAAAAVLLAVGCGSGQVQAQGQVSTSLNEGDDRKYETQEPVAPPTEAKPAPAPMPAAPEEHVHFLGVAHDLSLAAGVPRKATCHCLMVSAAAPNDPKFVWQGRSPKVDPATRALATAA